MTHRSRGPSDLRDRHLRLVPQPPRVPRPRTPWEPPTPEPRRERRRVAGQLIGLAGLLLLVGALAVALAAAVADPQPHRASTPGAAAPVGAGAGDAAGSEARRPAVGLVLERRVDRGARGQVALRLVVSNRGPTTALGVRVRTPLPRGTTLVEAPGSACRTLPAGIVRCGLGRVRPGRTAQATLVVTGGVGSGPAPLLRWIRSDDVHARGLTAG